MPSSSTLMVAARPCQFTKGEGLLHRIMAYSGLSASDLVEG